MAAPPLLTLQDVALTFGGTPLIQSAELTIAPGERACLVGRNGSGKSTLLKIAAGLVEVDRGTRFVQPGATIRYLAQEPDLSAFETTLAYVEAGLGPGDDPYRARYLLEQLGLTGEEKPAALSGGEGRRAALAQALAPQPDILLLDEPTNHLDLPAIEWLEGELKGLRSAMILISHDRRFLESLSDATIWLDRGLTRRMDRGLRAFRGLARRGAGAGGTRSAQARPQTRGRGRLAPLRRDRTAQAQRASARQPPCHAPGAAGATRRGRDGQHDARRERAIRNAGGRGREDFQGLWRAGPRLGPLACGFLRGDRLGIVGPNGAGKTTLINLLTGVTPPGCRRVRLGSNLQMITLDQRRMSLDPDGDRRRNADRRPRRHGDDRRPDQARGRLYEGLPVLARTGAHSGGRTCPAASATG